MTMSACSHKEEADLIITNAVVYKVNEEFSTAESFAVVDGEIAAVGSVREILDCYSAESVIDAHQKFIYPGFNDAHCHLNGLATNLMQYADLMGTSSPGEIYQVIQAHHQKFGGQWVLGRGWDQNDWKTTGLPDKSKLDVLFPETPVFLIRVDGHAGWCNSKALELAGITAQTKIPGGEVVTQNGEATGVLIDNAMNLVWKLIPEISEEQQKMGLAEAQKKCFAVGLTSVTDCGLDKESILLMQKMQSQNKLKLRINAMLNPTMENFDSFLGKGPLKTERMTINTIKIYADGALGSRGALLLEDYSDAPGNQGLQMEPQTYYDRICQLALDNQFAVATHCIGDSANRLIVDTYGKFLKGKNDKRWRIEHAQIIHPEDLPKFARFSIVPSVQATHATSDMYWAEKRLGKDRLQKGAYAYQTLLDQLGWLPNGTDFPVENINPLFTFYASIFRTDHSGWPEGGWLNKEALTREQALKSITLWPAKAAFSENEFGSLEPGMKADFVMLDTDLMHASPRKILEAKIESTWIDGRKVYELK